MSRVEPIIAERSRGVPVSTGSVMTSAAFSSSNSIQNRICTKHSGSQIAQTRLKGAKEHRNEKAEQQGLSPRSWASSIHTPLPPTKGQGFWLPTFTARICTTCQKHQRHKASHMRASSWAPVSPRKGRRREASLPISAASWERVLRSSIQRDDHSGTRDFPAGRQLAPAPASHAMPRLQRPSPGRKA